MRAPVAALAAIILLLAFGCAGAQPEQNAGAPAGETAAGTQAGAGAQASGLGAATEGTEGHGGNASAEFSRWNAPDGSITLQVPQGWQASERQVDNCTVNWAVRSPDGASAAFMTNQIMVLKSESARQMYKAYGMTGIDGAPVSPYLGVAQALSGVVAPLSGADNFRLLGTDAAAGAQLSQQLCIPGLAACEVQVADAAFDYKGRKMRGHYLVQSYDFGEGTAWWISIWGYEAPGDEWESAAPVLEKIFSSLQVTDKWVAKCGGGSESSNVVGEVIKSRQASSEKIANEWDAYIRGG